MVNINKSWEKRLRDLVYSYRNCSENYFEPEVFRINLNSFLQTARTVTFIIQKHKNEIIDFENWYNNNVLELIKFDNIMEWAKNSRNKIEKQGDLEIYSLAKASLVFSYFENEDIEINGCHNLIDIGVKRLIRFARVKLPTAVSTSSVIKVERRWVSKDLPNYELLYVLSVIYSRLYDICKKLTEYLGYAFDMNIPEPSTLSNFGMEGRYIKYIKMSDMGEYNIFHHMIKYDGTKIPKIIEDNLVDFKEQLNTNCSLMDLVNYHAGIAEIIFEHSGFHISIVFLFDNNNQVLTMEAFEPKDQVEKFIFWRMMADKVYLLKAKSLIFVCEAWERQRVTNDYTPISKFPIIGEKLMITGINSKDFYSVSWDIYTDKKENKKSLINKTKFNTSDGNNYIIPVVRAMNKIEANNL